MTLRRFMALPLLAIAGAALSGCVVAATPALAGSAIARSRVDSKEAKAPPAPDAAATSVPIAAAPAPVPSPVAIAVTAPVTAPIPAPTNALATVPPPEQQGFAQFVRYGSAVAVAAAGVISTPPLSAMLSDPVAIDGKRRRCVAGEQPVALIDLDPQGGVFTPPANPAKQPGLALGLAVLRDAGVVITWLSDLSVSQSGALRTALEQSGLDPRGEDIISLSRESDDRKQRRKDNLAGITCIIAIAGDERPDFDERFKYLRNSQAGAELEPVIGDGWFLVEPVFPNEQGQEP